MKDTCLFLPCSEVTPHFISHCGNRTAHCLCQWLGRRTLHSRGYGFLSIRQSLGFQLMWYLGIRTQPWGLHAVSSEPCVKSLCPYISTLHLLNLALCLESSSSVQAWGTLTRGQHAGREWSPVLCQSFPSRALCSACIPAEGHSSFLAAPSIAAFSDQQEFLLPLAPSCQRGKNSLPPSSRTGCWIHPLLISLNSFWAL